MCGMQALRLTNSPCRSEPTILALSLVALLFESLVERCSQRSLVWMLFSGCSRSALLRGRDAVGLQDSDRRNRREGLLARVERVSACQSHFAGSLGVGHQRYML